MRQHPAWYLRHAVTLLLLFSMVAMAVSLIHDARATPVLQPTAIPEVVKPHRDSQTLSADIVAEHLFGASIPAQSLQQAPVPPDISLGGILYSTSPGESRAILVISGVTLVCGEGARLADGGVVSAVRADEVLIQLDGAIIHIPLDIKRANFNEHYETLAVSGAGPAGIQSGYAPLSGPDDDGTETSTARPEAGFTPHPSFHGEFKPLSAIRGKDAASHFIQLGAPLPGRKAPTGKPPTP